MCDVDTFIAWPVLKSLNVLLWAAVGAWVGLAVARGRFWDARADGLREPLPDQPTPDVHAVVPARDEADVVARTLASLIGQQYAGTLRVTVVDDRSADGTGAAARALVALHGAAQQVSVVEARPRPAGWSGKVWAMCEGVAAVRSQGERPAFWWFTDADVEHDAQTLARLVATAVGERRDLVSLMVALHCRSGSERLLIPAFVYFFRLLYPFAWVNDDRRRTAAAAGGCILLADAALERIGGLERIAGELIDDCSLAAAVKRDGGRLWLGLATRSRSLRPYPSLGAIWDMVARTAYTQLAYSPLLLAGTVAGMTLLYLAPPAAALGGTLTRRWEIALPGALAWSMMSATYLPTVRRYGLSRRSALTLPVAAALYAAMTVDSALRHRRGRGGRWKGRSFAPEPR
ncbi:MAG: glycosyltransferase [Candidatus Elarobacter sp.]